jgi:hypothetical protein
VVPGIAWQKVGTHAALHREFGLSQQLTRTMSLSKEKLQPPTFVVPTFTKNVKVDLTCSPKSEQS